MADRDDRGESRRQIARRQQRKAGDRSARLANALMKLPVSALGKLGLDEDLRASVDRARAVTAGDAPALPRGWPRPDHRLPSRPRSAALPSAGRWRWSALRSTTPLYIGARPGVDGRVLRWVCRAAVLLLPPAFIRTTTTRRAVRT